MVAHWAPYLPPSGGSAYLSWQRMLSRSASNENENIFPAWLGRWEELAELNFPLIWNYHSSLALRKQNGDFLCGSCPSWGRRNRYFMLDLWRSALDHVVDKNSSHHILWRHLFVLCQRSETTFNIFQQLTPNREWSVMARVSFEGQKKSNSHIRSALSKSSDVSRNLARKYAPWRIGNIFHCPTLGEEMVVNQSGHVHYGWEH